MCPDKNWILLDEIPAFGLRSKTESRKAFFIVEANGEQLAYMAELFNSGVLKAFVKAEVPLENADRAYAGSVTGKPGKIVIGTI